MFHDIDANTAEMAFSHLRKKYNLISLKEYVEANRSNNGTTLPEKSMIITFDDGYLTNYTLLPVIKKYNIPVTVFLCAGIINTKRHYWFINENMNGTKKDLKRMPNKQRLEILKEYGFYNEREYDHAQALSKVQIMEMAPYVDFQGHTLFHPCLPCSEDIEVKTELIESKKILEKEYNLNVYGFAYPNGDYSVRDIEILKKENYKCALTLDSGYNNQNTDLFRLKRFSVNDTTNLDELIVKSTGLWSLFKPHSGLRKHI